jgi:hypothetical protein
MPPSASSQVVPGVPLESLFEAIGDGAWRLDAREGRVQVNQAWAQRLRCPREEGHFTAQEWLELIHPDDLPQVRERMKAHAAGRTRRYHSEHRIRTADGGWLWVLDRGCILARDEAGRALYAAGTHMDISERRRAEEGLQSAHHDLIQAMESIPGAFALFDRENRLQRCNSRYLALLPDPLQAQPLGRSFEELTREILRRQLEVDGDDLEACVQEQLRRHGRPGERVQYRGRTGSVIRVEERETEDGGTVILGVDITEDIAREDELERTRIAAETANAGKDQFVAAISHELRGPLQAMLGNAELLLLSGEHQLRPEQLKQVRTILECGERQMRLLNELLDKARAESGRMEVRPCVVALEPAVKSVVEALRPEASKWGVDLLPDKLEGRVVADPHRLDEVLMNLLSNAVKYNRPGGWVRVRAERPCKGWRRLVVVDSGLGIPAERQAEVFEPYNRLGREAGAAKGTGLGLSLARKLVERMGGRIGFESRPGAGTTFWVDLPDV